MTPSESPSSTTILTDRIVKILRAQNGAIERNGEMLASLARQVASVDRNVEGLIRSLSEFHGNREAAEVEAARARVKNNQTLELIAGQVRGLGPKVAELEAQMRRIMLGNYDSSPGNGGGNGNGGRDGV